MKCRSMQGGRCTDPLALPLYGDLPSPGVCRICPHYRGLPRGLGDAVDAFTRLTGIKAVADRLARQRASTARKSKAVGTPKAGIPRGCGGCAARRQALNEKFPIS